MFKAIKSTINYFILPHKYIIKHFRLLYLSTFMEIRQNYAGSILGIIWLVLSPIILLGLYTFIYAVVFRFRPSGMNITEYILYIFCGLVAFLGFNNGLVLGISSLSANKQILLNTVYPAELLPIRSVLSGSTVILIGYTIVCLSALLLSESHLTFLLIPFFVVLQLMFVVGLCWILSLANLVMRDIQQFIGYITTLLLIISPIAYTPEMIPGSLRAVIYLNPLSYYVLSFQSLVISGRLPPLEVTVICIVQSILLFSLGFWVFSRTKKVFFDFT